jgi:hypothetical protein
VDAEMWRRLRGLCGRGHGEIIRRGDEEKNKDNAEAQSTRSPAEMFATGSDC